ncbi:lipocalin family protein [Christiangramia aquimixticola]|uniref:lipocalin family protein n=1 Tax=Christiangramia aquimixticola TaxID=1697558 RepID=UPI003AA8D5F8
MKKIFILLVAVSLFMACSDDDSATDDGAILGTWFMVEANNVPGYSLDDCSRQSYITFNMDKSANSEFYSTVDGNCVSDSSSGTWSSSSNSQYTFEIPQLGEVTGTVSFSSDSRFTFRPNSLPTSSITFEK